MHKVFGLLSIILVPVFCMAESMSESLDKSLKKSQKTVSSGHAYIRSLACADGSTPTFLSVFTDSGSSGFIDHYVIGCKDGTKGQFTWDDSVGAPANPPAGFRLKTESELRAFKFRGRINEISVAPSSTIWLTTATGYSYFSNDMGDKWSVGSLRATEQYADSIDRITFFDKNHAIASGNMAGNFFITSDGGLTWNQSKLKNSQAIYTVFSRKDGKGWMAGSKGDILYSADFGKTWKSTATQFKFDNRVYSLFMKNEKFGIAGSLDGDELRITQDNWTTSQKIPTPRSQGVPKSIGQNSINKIFISKEMIIVQQGNSVFKSPISSVKWVELSDVTFVSADYDPDKDIFYLFDGKGFVYSSRDLKDFKKLSSEPIQGNVIDSKFLNDSLFILSSEYIYKINEEKFLKSSKLPE